MKKFCFPEVLVKYVSDHQQESTYPCSKVTDIFRKRKDTKISNGTRESCETKCYLINNTFDSKAYNRKKYYIPNGYEKHVTIKKSPVKKQTFLNTLGDSEVTYYAKKMKKKLFGWVPPVSTVKTRDIGNSSLRTLVHFIKNNENPTNNKRHSLKNAADENVTEAVDEYYRNGERESEEDDDIEVGQTMTIKNDSPRRIPSFSVRDSPSLFSSYSPYPFFDSTYSEMATLTPMPPKRVALLKALIKMFKVRTTITRKVSMFDAKTVESNYSINNYKSCSKNMMPSRGNSSCLTLKQLNNILVHPINRNLSEPNEVSKKITSEKNYKAETVELNHRNDPLMEALSSLTTSNFDKSLKDNKVLINSGYRNNFTNGILMNSTAVLGDFSTEGIVKITHKAAPISLIVYYDYGAISTSSNSAIIPLQVLSKPVRNNPTPGTTTAPLSNKRWNWFKGSPFFLWPLKKLLNDTNDESNTSRNNRPESKSRSPGICLVLTAPSKLLLHTNGSGFPVFANLSEFYSRTSEEQIEPPILDPNRNFLKNEEHKRNLNSYESTNYERNCITRNPHVTLKNARLLPTEGKTIDPEDITINSLLLQRLNASVSKKPLSELNKLGINEGVVEKLNILLNKSKKNCNYNYWAPIELPLTFSNKNEVTLFRNFIKNDRGYLQKSTKGKKNEITIRKNNTLENPIVLSHQGKYSVNGEEKNVFIKERTRQTAFPLSAFNFRNRLFPVNNTKMNRKLVVPGFKLKIIPAKFIYDPEELPEEMSNTIPQFSKPHRDYKLRSSANEKQSLEQTEYGKQPCEITTKRKQPTETTLAIRECANVGYEKEVPETEVTILPLNSKCTCEKNISSGNMANRENVKLTEHKKQLDGCLNKQKRFTKLIPLIITDRAVIMYEEVSGVSIPQTKCTCRRNYRKSTATKSGYRVASMERGKRPKLVINKSKKFTGPTFFFTDCEMTAPEEASEEEVTFLSKPKCKNSIQHMEYVVSPRHGKLQKRTLKTLEPSTESAIISESMTTVCEEDEADNFETRDVVNEYSDTTEYSLSISDESDSPNLTIQQSSNEAIFSKMPTLSIHKSRCTFSKKLIRLLNHNRFHVTNKPTTTSISNSSGYNGDDFNITATLISDDHEICDEQGGEGIPSHVATTGEEEGCLEGFSENQDAILSSAYLSNFKSNCSMCACRSSSESLLLVTSQKPRTDPYFKRAKKLENAINCTSTTTKKNPKKMKISRVTSASSSSIHSSRVTSTINYLSSVDEMESEGAETDENIFTSVSQNKETVDDDDDVDSSEPVSDYWDVEDTSGLETDCCTTKTVRPATSNEPVSSKMSTSMHIVTSLVEDTASILKFNSSSLTSQTVLTSSIAETSPSPKIRNCTCSPKRLWRRTKKPTVNAQRTLKEDGHIVSLSRNSLISRFKSNHGTFPMKKKCYFMRKRCKLCPLKQTKSSLKDKDITLPKSKAIKKNKTDSLSSTTSSLTPWSMDHSFDTDQSDPSSLAKASLNFRSASCLKHFPLKSSEKPRCLATIRKSSNKAILSRCRCANILLKDGNDIAPVSSNSISAYQPKESWTLTFATPSVFRTDHTSVSLNKNIDEDSVVNNKIYYRGDKRFKINNLGANPAKGNDAALDLANGNVFPKVLKGGNDIASLKIVIGSKDQKTIKENPEQKDNFKKKFFTFETEL